MAQRTIFFNDTNFPSLQSSAKITDAQLRNMKQKEREREQKEREREQKAKEREKEQKAKEQRKKQRYAEQEEHDRKIRVPSKKGIEMNEEFIKQYTQELQDLKTNTELSISEKTDKQKLLENLLNHTREDLKKGIPYSCGDEDCIGCRICGYESITDDPEFFCQVCRCSCYDENPCLCDIEYAKYSK